MRTDLALLLEIGKLVKRIAEQQDPIYFTFSPAEEPILIPRSTPPRWAKPRNQEKWQGRGKRRKPKAK